MSLAKFTTSTSVPDRVPHQPARACMNGLRTNRQRAVQALRCHFLLNAARFSKRPSGSRACHKKNTQQQRNAGGGCGARPMSADLHAALAVIEERQSRLAELKSVCADKAETIARLARGDLAGQSKTITLGICAMRKKISKPLVCFSFLKIQTREC